MLILARFKDGRVVTYTDAVLWLLMADQDVLTIVDVNTGKLLKG